MRRLAFVAIATMLLAGCAAVPAADEPAPVARIVSGTGSPIGLLNLWRVSAHGAGDDAFLRLDASGLTAWTACGTATGSWRATGAAFLASVWGASGGADCLGATPTAAPVDSLEWLYAARGFRLSDVADQAQLLGDDGTVVAELRVDGAPAPSPDLSDDYLLAPDITPAAEALFADPPALPEGVAAATAAGILGRWEPEGEFGPEQPFVHFAVDGTWTGTDGCNHGGGRWSMDAAGALLATSGASTLIGCDAAAVPFWVASAATVGIVDSQLVLFDTAGFQLGALDRS